MNQRTNTVFDTNLIKKSSFDDEDSYDNFCKAIKLCKKFYEAKSLGLLPDSKRNGELYIDYAPSDYLIYYLRDGTGRGYDVIVNEENNFPIVVYDEDLEWFDFLKDIKTS